MREQLRSLPSLWAVCSPGSNPRPLANPSSCCAVEGLPFQRQVLDVLDHGFSTLKIVDVLGQMIVCDGLSCAL